MTTVWYPGGAIEMACLTGIAVGTEVALRPPHRFVRAELPHTAPALSYDVKKQIPSGFFNLPDAENVSAVLFTNTGTIPKFLRMANDLSAGRRHHE